MAVSRLQEWRFHLVRTKRGYQSTVFTFPKKCWLNLWFACSLNTESGLEIVNISGENWPASTLDLHSRHHLYHSKRVNPPEVTINNELKPANAMYIGQQFQVMRTFMSTCEFHPAVNAVEPQRKAQKAHSRRVWPIYLFNICYIHDTQANNQLFLPGIRMVYANNLTNVGVKAVEEV